MITINGKDYDVRPVCGKDIFALLRVLKKADLKEALSSVKEQTDTVNLLEVLQNILFGLEGAEDEIFDFLASFMICDGKALKGKDLANAEPVVLLEAIKIVISQEGFGNFFKHVGAMLQSK